MNAELSRVNRLVKKQEELYHQCAKRAGLTDTQFWVLYALCEEDAPLCQNSFCENWCYSKQTVNASVASLEKLGLLRLTYAEGSRKQKDITLTEEGEHFCDAHIRRLLRAESTALMHLSAAEREAFFKTLERLLDCLEKELV